MPEIAQILERRLDFDPDGDFEAFVHAAPAKWVVYLMTDADDMPLQLLCVKNLRYSLKRRLGGEESFTLSRRVNYRQIVRHVYFRRVDSAFEADWVYYELARQVFPTTYQGMVGFRPGWFVHVNPQTQFPRYTKTIDPTGVSGIYLGPIEDKHAAGRLIELIEHWFDLCRYYNILVQAPNGKACAYKEMGKCPAPCDGSISMPQYRRMIEWSAQTLANPASFLREQKIRMQQAAGELRFETAGKIKQLITEMSEIGKGPYRHLQRLEDFCFVSFQAGPRPATARIFLILPGQIVELVDLIDAPHPPGAIMRLILESAEDLAGKPITPAGAERIGIVANHLFSARATQGVFIRLNNLSEKALLKGYSDLSRQKRSEEPGESEGVVKELQAVREL